MKNVTVLSQPDEIHAFAARLFRTPEFRQSYNDGGLVHQVVDKLATWPRYFFERSDDRLETAHFTAWWGGIQLHEKDYPNDVVHDLYLLHEMWHAATMPCREGLLYDLFAQKAIDNEAYASVISEVAAYFAMPGLREKSFNFEIYADRFMKDPVYQDMWRDNHEEFIHGMVIDRRNIMHPDYQPKDLPEKWIHLFAAQNRDACEIWRNTYDKVETAMVKLRRECVDPAIGRDRAMKNFMTWLTSDEISRRTDIPFPDEAKAFADIYWRNKTEYKKEVEKDPAPPATSPASAGGIAPKVM